MKIRFYKMQGIGNDYVYINCFESPIENPAKLAVRVSDRHFGIGSDGLILLCPSETADLKMSMFNADGSEGRMCGNGIRCVGKLAYETGLVDSTEITVETLSGIRRLRLLTDGGKVSGAQVDMGAPVLEAAKLPALTPERTLVNAPLTVGGSEYRITCVSMGNPHAVIFTSGIDGLDLQGIGPLFEHHAMFPEGVNTEFAELLGKNELKMRVWERGSGETMACGTGACAVAVAACLNGLVGRAEDVTIRLLGGSLTIRWEETCLMTGRAELVFTGEIEI
ncbi:MAG: diaminopimelate epimerase [Clostridia bacterium]|nr:diaminopimelate epimerase [Clostridia bacterium]